jgi:hypothetical protein
LRLLRFPESKKHPRAKVTSHIRWGMSAGDVNDS